MITGSERQDAARPASRGRRILRNFASMTTGKLAGDLSTLVLLAAISRVYGETGLGTYSLAMAISGFLAVTSNFGLTQLSIKELSRAENSAEQFARFLVTRSLLVVATIALLLLLAPIMQWTQQIGVALLLIGSSQILFSVGEGFGALLIAREEMHLAAGLEFVLRVVTMLGVCTGCLAHWPLLLVLLVLPLTNLVFAAVTAGFVLNRYGALHHLQWRRWRSTLRTAIPYGTAELLEQFASRVDILMVGMLLGTVAAGIYNAGFRILFSLNFIPAFAAKSIFPLLTRMHHSQPSAGQALFSRALGSAVLVAVPAAVGLWLVAPDVITLIFGNGFAQSATVLRYLVALIPLNCMVQFMAMYLMATERQPLCTRMQWWAAAMNTLGNIVLVPTIGVIGAALSTLAAYTVLLGLLSTRVAREVDSRHIASRLLIALIGSAVIVALALVVNINFLLFIPLAATAHLITICAFPSIRRAELADALALWRHSGETVNSGAK